MSLSYAAAKKLLPIRLPAAIYCWATDPIPLNVSPSIAFLVSHCGSAEQKRNFCEGVGLGGWFIDFGFLPRLIILALVYQRVVASGGRITRM